MTVFIGAAPVEDNILSECIGTAVATYDNCTDKKQTANDIPRIPVHAA